MGSCSTAAQEEFTGSLRHCAATNPNSFETHQAGTDAYRAHAQDAISRVQSLEQEGRITGVMDDRGKFIYISREEMAATAEFIMGRGRIAISELAAKSSNFIDLEPK